MTNAKDRLISKEEKDKAVSRARRNGSTDTDSTIAAIHQDAISYHAGIEDTLEAVRAELGHANQLIERAVRTKLGIAEDSVECDYPHCEAPCTRNCNEAKLDNWSKGL